MPRSFATIVTVIVHRVRQEQWSPSDLRLQPILRLPKESNYRLVYTTSRRRSGQELVLWVRCVMPVAAVAQRFSCAEGNVCRRDS